MRALIVNNGTKDPTALTEAFPNAEVISWNKLKEVNLANFDLAVLSGSSNFPVMGNESELAKELELIRLSPIPVLGICYGFELIVVAFGGTLKMLPHKENGVLELTVEGADPVFDGIDKLIVYEGHRWIADSIPESLIPLAKSPHGIEAVRHKDRLIYGFQFHPEKHLNETVGRRILDNFVSLAGF